MEALQQAIEIADTDLAFVSDDDLEEFEAVLGRALSQVKAQMARCAAEAKRRGSHRREGVLSLTSWIAFHADMDKSEARSLTALASTMTAHPVTAVKVVSGELSHARARILSRAAEAHPEMYQRDEHILVDQAESLRLRDLSLVVGRWQNYADDAAAEKAAGQKREVSHLHASVTSGGMVRVDGFLDPELGESLLTALDAATPPPVAGDGRSGPNRRAEALGVVCERFLQTTDTDNGGVPASVMLVVDTDTLEGRYGRHCEMEHTGPVTVETARRLLCDSAVCRVVMKGISEILDLGRSTRVVSPALRRALNLRDGHCRFRGCERPATWCDAHHVIHWLHDGPTNLENCILVCRRHHTMVHEGRAVVVGRDVLPVSAVSQWEGWSPDPERELITLGRLRE